MAAPLQMEWVSASCDTEHSASGARVKCSPIPPKARSSPAVCRCKPMHTFVPYHDTEITRSEKITHRRGRGSSTIERWSLAADWQPGGPHLCRNSRGYRCREAACRGV